MNSHNDADAFPRDWQVDAAPEDHLEPWRPDAPMSARAAEFVAAYLADPNSLATTKLMLTMAKDSYRDFSWPELLLAALEISTSSTVAAIGRPLAVARAVADVEHLRERALEQLKREVEQ
jgi:hypothetical protein